MALDLRMMHIKPGGSGRTWDIKLMDERQNARVFITPDGKEFIDLVIMGGEHYRPKNIKPKHDHQVLKSKAQRRKQLKRRRQKALGA